MKAPRLGLPRPDGHIVDYNGDIHACINGDYQQVCAQYHRGAAQHPRFRRHLFNMGGYQTTVIARLPRHRHCALRTLSGAFGWLPARKGRLTVYRKYLLFKRETMRAAMHRVWTHIHALRPEICCDHETELLTGYLRQESTPNLTARCRTGSIRQLQHQMGCRHLPGLISVIPRSVHRHLKCRHVAVRRTSRRCAWPRTWPTAER